MTSVFADISDIPLAQLLGLFVTLPGFIWLDSSDVHSSQSHQSYLMAEPIAQFDEQSDNASFPHFLDRWLPKTPLSSGLVAGYIGYEAPSKWDIPEFSSVQFHKHPTWPQIWLGVYPIVVQIDHITHKITLIVNTGIVGDVRPQWVSRLRAAAPYQTVDPRLTLIVDSTAHDQFIDAVRSTQHHISEGNIYQLNLTRQIQANLTSGNPFDVYLKMRQSNPSPFGAYIDTGLIQIMSMSPELFFKVSDGIIETRPIKGTGNRSGSADTAEAMALRNSEKDSAELTMIVDLLRNDLGRICTPGSVLVPHLKTVETYSTLHHLVATVRGKLAPTASPLTLLTTLFPGGSITGAPKGRAMALIGEIESSPRSIYTGGIGYFGMDGTHQFNIAIRTAIHDSGRVVYHTGCGIVANSRPESEWKESVTKARAFEALCAD